MRAESWPARNVSKIASIALASLVMAAVGLSRKPSNIDALSSPDACVQAMLTAALDGEAKAYLSCFADPLCGQLKAQADADAAKFHDFLLASGTDMKGVATTQLEQTGDRARLVIERIYSEYRTRQPIELRADSGIWKIEKLGPLERAVPLVRYGTPVFVPAPDNDPPATGAVEEP